MNLLENNEVYLLGVMLLVAFRMQIMRLRIIFRDNRFRGFSVILLGPIPTVFQKVNNKVELLAEKNSLQAAKRFAEEAQTELSEFEAAYYEEIGRWKECGLYQDIEELLERWKTGERWNDAFDGSEPGDYLDLKKSVEQWSSHRANSERKLNYLKHQDTMFFLRYKLHGFFFLVFMLGFTFLFFLDSSFDPQGPNSPPALLVYLVLSWYFSWLFLALSMGLLMVQLFRFLENEILRQLLSEALGLLLANPQEVSVIFLTFAYALANCLFDAGEFYLEHRLE